MGREGRRWIERTKDGQRCMCLVLSVTSHECGQMWGGGGDGESYSEVAAICDREEQNL